MKPKDLKAVWVQRITDIEADDRFPSPFALVGINAPLALIQTGLRTERDVLEKCVASLDVD